MSVQITEDTISQEEEQDQPLEQAPGNTFVPQLELVNGKMVPNARSLVVQAQPEATNTIVKPYENLINNQSHSKRIKSERWSEKETDMFFMVSVSRAWYSNAMPAHRH